MAAMRWEWRGFGEERLQEAAGTLGASEPVRVAESDEIYLLADGATDAVKLRDGLLDVKHLEEVNEDGLQLWGPVLKAAVPVSSQDARQALAALGVRAELDVGRHGLDDLVAAADGAIRSVVVHKVRRHHEFGGCMAEVTDLWADRRLLPTIAVEAEDPDAVVAAVTALGLVLLPNVSVPEELLRH